MPVTLGVTREFEFTANDLNNNNCIFPRDPRNSVFVQLTDFRTKRVSAAPAQYCAFPYIVKLGSSLVGIYSDGPSHAQSERQIMIRSDDGGLTWSSATFTENGSSTYNTSLLSGLLASGASVVLKVWTIKNNAGTLAVTSVSTVENGGVTYALWSRPIPSPTGTVLYRTGYGSNGTNTQTAMFQSSDGGVTWTFGSLMFATAGRNYSESDMVRTTGDNLVAVVREDLGAGNPLYYITSDNNGTSWSAPVAIPTTTVNGRQPNLMKLSDGSYVLAVGDRAGVSGYSGSGDRVAGVDTTGITMVRSTDAVTWGTRTSLAGMYSTDGGQPFVNETDAGRICAVFYHRRGINKQPEIGCSMVNVAAL